MNGSMMLGMLFWFLFVIGLVVITIFIIIKIVRDSKAKADHSSETRDTSGAQILDDRYAKGEITEQEYRRKKLMMEEFDSR